MKIYFFMFISIVLVSCSIDKICDCCCKGSCYCDSMKCGCASETAVIVDSLVNLNFNCKIQRNIYQIIKNYSYTSNKTHRHFQLKMSNIKYFVCNALIKSEFLIRLINIDLSMLKYLSYMYLVLNNLGSTNSRPFLRNC